MDTTVIVYVDDAAQAQRVLAPLLAGPGLAGAHWVLVACAPRMTHRISKWVSHSARENLRAKWADKLFAQMVPALRLPAARVTTVVAKGPLPELTQQLQAGAAAAHAVQVVDARRPKLQDGNGAPAERRPVPPTPLSGTLGSLLSGLSVLWVLAGD